MSNDQTRTGREQVIDHLAQALANAYGSVSTAPHRDMAQIAYAAIDHETLARMAALNGFALTPDKTAQNDQVGEWRHCSPALLRSGVDCASTPRRPCPCEGGHDHWIDLPDRAQ